ncbi:MAG: alpha/beta hydrolase [Erysipelotrichia bacterium]|nr:alpha/beta hydrolase [Erysipelotrichia bacterium]
MKTILIHGLGQTPSSWDHTLQHMKHTSDIIVLDLFTLIKNKPFNYENLYTAFANYCLYLHEPLNLCGLSLGGILALQFATNYPQTTNSLLLIGARYNVPKTLFKLQNIIFKCMPKQTFTQMNVAKEDFIALSKSMINIDLEKDLKNITCPTLVLCGEKDKANKKASMVLQNKIAKAELVIIENANHEVNVDAPQKLAITIEHFLNQ